MDKNGTRNRKVSKNNKMKQQRKKTSNVIKNQQRIRVKSQTTDGTPSHACMNVRK